MRSIDLINSVIKPAESTNEPVPDIKELSKKLDDISTTVDSLLEAIKNKPIKNPKEKKEKETAPKGDEDTENNKEE